MTRADLEGYSVGELFDIIHQLGYLYPKKERKAIEKEDVSSIIKGGVSYG